MVIPLLSPNDSRSCGVSLDVTLALLISTGNLSKEEANYIAHYLGPVTLPKNLYEAIEQIEKAREAYREEIK